MEEQKLGFTMLVMLPLWIAEKHCWYEEVKKEEVEAAVLSWVAQLCLALAEHLAPPLSHVPTEPGCWEEEEEEEEGLFLVAQFCLARVEH